MRKNDYCLVVAQQVWYVECLEVKVSSVLAYEVISLLESEADARAVHSVEALMAVDQARLIVGVVRQRRMSARGIPHRDIYLSPLILPSLNTAKFTLRQYFELGIQDAPSNSPVTRSSEISTSPEPIRSSPFDSFA